MNVGLRAKRPPPRPFIVMNRNGANDSKVSLDENAVRDDSEYMLLSPSGFDIHLQRIDAQKNMARYYALSVERNLFGEICLVRPWGRIGSTGPEKTEILVDEGEGARLMAKFCRVKLGKGYMPAMTCGML